MGDHLRSLVIGGGGREHCIMKALQRSGCEVFAVAANRNPGIAKSAVDFLLHDVTDSERIVPWAKSKSIDLAIVGPEAPLGSGMVDALGKAGIPAFGPSKSAAQIELSKEFARNLMRDHKVPGLINYWAFKDATAFREWVKRCDFEFVMKPIGLTGGKGVKVWGDHLKSKADAVAYAEEIGRDGIGGSARFVVEEKAVGEEFSLQAFSDGNSIAPMPLAQDHKRALEGDEGPNTGGMGSFSDADHLLPFVTRGEYESALEIMRKTVMAMKKNGTPFRGCLYGGFIATKDGPRVIEFNSRFADPECMNTIPIMESDFAAACMGAAIGALKTDVRFARKATVCKYVVPEGYGSKSLLGQLVDVNEKAITDTGAELFWASVEEKGGKTYTTTSRSLAVVGIEDDIESAEEVAEAALRHVKGRVYMRHDIGKKGIVARKVKRMEAIRKEAA